MFYGCEVPKKIIRQLKSTETATTLANIIVKVLSGQMWNWWFLT